MMTSQKALALLLFSLLLDACGKSSPPPAPAPIAALPRPAEVPAEGVLTLATPADVARAAAFAADPAIQKAINDYIATAHLTGPTKPLESRRRPARRRLRAPLD